MAISSKSGVPSCASGASKPEIETPRHTEISFDCTGTQGVTNKKTCMLGQGEVLLLAGGERECRYFFSTGRETWQIEAFFPLSVGKV